MIRARVALGMLPVLTWCAAAHAEPDAWYLVDSPTTIDLGGIAFARDGAGWAVGKAGTVLRYDGTAWQRIPGPDAEALQLPVALSADELWTCGPGNRLDHYHSGQWTTTRLDPDFDCQGIDFVDPQLGYAAGLFGMLYRYDGSWQRVGVPALVNDRESHLGGVAALAAGDVWVGGATGFVLHFDGHGWQRLQPRPAGAGGRLARLGDSVALLDAPVLARRGTQWQAVAPVAVVSLAARDGAIWGVATSSSGGALWETPASSSLSRLWPDRSEPVAVMRGVEAIAAGPDGLWAVGDGGMIARLGHRSWPAFVDRTFEAGVGVLAASTIALLADLDGRGKPDLLLAVPFGRNSFLRAETPGEFRAEPVAPSATGAMPDATALALADLDGDGRIDLVLRPPGQAGARPLHVLRNLGSLRFRDVGPGSPALASQDSSQLGALEVADLDGDGDLDIYEVRYLHQPDGVPVPNVLWTNDGFGRFSAQDLAHRDGGGALAWSRGALAADLDGDGRIDLLSINSWADGNTFYRQDQHGALIDATADSGLAGAIQDGVSAVAGDIDGDGALDVLVLSNAAYGPSRLYRNDGHGRFHDVTSESGLDRVFASARRAELADVDLDGDLDLIVVGARPAGAVAATGNAPLRLLLNDGRGRFTDVTTQTGVGQWAEDVVVDDFDGDGDLDLYLVRPGASNRLLINEPPADAGWLTVVPTGAPPNRAALGARVWVHRPGGGLLAMRETSWRHPAAQFGLGSAEIVDVEVRFPSGTVVRRTGVAARQVLEVTEQGRPQRWFREAVFSARHHWAWADPSREGTGLALALAWILALHRLGPRLGARRWMARRAVAATLLGLYIVLAVVTMPVAPVSALANRLPLAATAALGAAALALDRRWTRRAEARFVGPYELLGLLGEGGMGIVYRARDTTQPGRPIVALKVLRPDRVASPGNLRRLMQEAELGGRLRHPGIASVLASGECRVLDGRVWRTSAYLAMECVEGHSLAARLAEQPPLPLARAVEIVRDAAAALAAAHAAGVLHRDIKPDNLLLSPAGIVKLVDFGIATAVRAMPRSEAGVLVGTLAYIPPERVAGRAEDARGDLYALGAVLYEAVCGRPPFAGPDAAALLAAVASELPVRPRALRPDLPAALDAVICTLLAKDPEQRPPSAEHLIEALTEILRLLAGQARDTDPANRPSRAAPGRAAPVCAGIAPSSPAPPLRRPPGPDDRVTLDLPRAAADELADSKRWPSAC